MTAWEFLDSTELHHGKNLVGVDTLNQYPVTALYFSAHWCPPCKVFTPKLIKFYNRVNAANKQLEIVFISADQAEDEFHMYYFGEDPDEEEEDLEAMPWTAVKFDEEKLSEISSEFDIGAIPTLLIVNSEGKVANPSDFSTKKHVTEVNDLSDAQIQEAFGQWKKAAQDLQ